jgi:hypothetical protein
LNLLQFTRSAKVDIKFEEEDGDEDDEEDGDEEDEEYVGEAEDLVEVDAARVRKNNKKATSGLRGPK